MSLSTQIDVYDGCKIFQFLLLLLQSLLFYNATSIGWEKTTQDTAMLM